ncbi:hypothetical protein KI387_012011, partial [Taxus chinensis]
LLRRFASRASLRPRCPSTNLSHSGRISRFDVFRVHLSQISLCCLGQILPVRPIRPIRVILSRMCPKLF